MTALQMPLLYSHNQPSSQPLIFSQFTRSPQCGQQGLSVRLQTAGSECVLADGGATKDPIQHLLPKIQDREMLQLLNGRALPSTVVINGPSGVGKGTLIGQVCRLRLYIDLYQPLFLASSLFVLPVLRQFFFMSVLFCSLF